MVAGMEKRKERICRKKERRKEERSSVEKKEGAGNARREERMALMVPCLHVRHWLVHCCH